MVINISLDTQTVKILNYYGDISTVVNRILKHGELGEIPLMDLPMAPLPDKDVKQCKIDVTNECYLELCRLYGVKSSRISLRRIICWFIDNEKYVEFDWNVKKLDNSVDERIKLLNELDEKVYQLRKHFKYNEHLLNIKAEIDIMKTEVWDE